MMEGIASIALLPEGSISGHFIQLPDSVCYGLHGSVGMRMSWAWSNKKDEKSKILVTFECETLKAEKAAEDHIRRFMPKLAGLDAVVNLLFPTEKLLYFGKFYSLVTALHMIALSEARDNKQLTLGG